MHIFGRVIVLQGAGDCRDRSFELFFEILVSGEFFGHERLAPDTIGSREVVTEKISAARAFSSLKEPVAWDRADDGVRANLPRITRDQELLVASTKKSLRQRDSSRHAEAAERKTRFHVEQVMIAKRVPKLVTRVENVFVPINARSRSNCSQLEAVRRVEDVVPET